MVKSRAVMTSGLAGRTRVVAMGLALRACVTGLNVSKGATRCVKVCGRLVMSSPAIDDVYVLTIVTGSKKEGCKSFWFGRRDMSDNLKPTKIDAVDNPTAWRLLEEKEKAKCSQPSSSF